MRLIGTGWVCASCGDRKQPRQIAFVLDYTPNIPGTWLVSGDAVCTFCADQSPELFDEDAAQLIMEGG